MALTSLIQILKLNEPRSGVKDGRPWSMQDAECLLLSDTGEVEQVGVLMVPKELREKLTQGVYTASFALRSNMASRRIEAVLTHLAPINAAPPVPVKSPAPAVPVKGA